MKSRSTLFLLAGVTLGAIATLILRPQTGMKKSRREGRRQAKKHNKTFREVAHKYKEKLGSAAGAGAESVNTW